MTTEERRYIIFENSYRGRQFNDIAAELGIDPSTISHDRNRHQETWEKEVKWLELLLKDKLNKGFSKSIEESRAYLMDLLCRIKELGEMKTQLLHAIENNEINPKNIVMFLNNHQEMEDVLLNTEMKWHVWLAQLLERKSKIRQSSVEDLKGIAVIDIAVIE